MGRSEDAAFVKGTVRLTAARERGDVDRQFQSRLTVTRSMIDRLGLEKELHGHMGCVNCLEWNRDGSVLASASDDLHVILWDPYRYKQLHNIATGHTGNIFSVKFLTPDIIATCAADGTVRARSVIEGASLLECTCHCGRVKRLATAPDNPHLICSAGEDGLILQHDLRMSHTCNSDSPNVLVNLLNHLGRHAEAKCVAINPRRPHQLAVGANDFYVRLYDTRMIKLAKNQGGRLRRFDSLQGRGARAGHGDPDNNIPRAAVNYFAPGHLSMEPNEHTFPKKATTYVTFSHDGNELLVNLGSEQVYLFDINSARRPVLVESFIIQHNHGYREGEGKPKNGTNGTTGSNGTGGANGTNGANGTVEPQTQLPEKVRQLKETANELVNKGNYSTAVQLYNDAIGICPDCAILYSNRAAALMRRAWSGDTYAAIKDCYRAIALDSGHVKSHFRLAKALMELRRAREAHECLLYFRQRFPKHASSHAVVLLQKDINVALEQRDTQPDEAAETEENQSTSVLERQLRASALDYSQRFLGHCNTTTDIKEANFLGPDANFIAAGSDDGSMFIWCRDSGNIVRVLRGDESIVNCVQLHPGMFLLATSGIEAVVRLWSPRPEDGSEEARVVRDAAAAARANQQRMRSDPFEAMLFNISYAGGERSQPHSPACRPTCVTCCRHTYIHTHIHQPAAHAQRPVRGHAVQHLVRGRRAQPAALARLPAHVRHLLQTYIHTYTHTPTSSACAATRSRPCCSTSRTRAASAASRTRPPAGPRASLVADIHTYIHTYTNQQRMRSDPFEAMLFNISYAGGERSQPHSPACRPTCVTCCRHTYIHTHIHQPAAHAQRPVRGHAVQHLVRGRRAQPAALARLPAHVRHLLQTYIHTYTHTPTSSACAATRSRPCCSTSRTRAASAASRTRPPAGPRASLVADIHTYIHTYTNQQRMRSDPFEAMLFNISYAGGERSQPHSPACRPTCVTCCRHTYIHTHIHQPAAHAQRPVRGHAVQHLVRGRRAQPAALARLPAHVRHLLQTYIHTYTHTPTSSACAATRSRPCCSTSRTRAASAASRTRPPAGPRASLVADIHTYIHTYTNQQRMRSDPFEAMLFNISYAGGERSQPHSPACRPTCVTCCRHTYIHTHIHQPAAHAQRPVRGHAVQHLVRGRRAQPAALARLPAHVRHLLQTYIHTYTHTPTSSACAATRSRPCCSTSRTRAASAASRTRPPAGPRKTRGPRIPCAPGFHSVTIEQVIVNI
nr:unnamed protein product [Amyelois transitella]